MKIPDMELHQSHARSYGGGSFELVPGYDDPGCPRLYQAKYELERVVWDDSWQRQYGAAVHKAIDIFEGGSITPEAALEKIWPVVLGPERFIEAVRDLTRMVERLAVETHTVATEQFLRMKLYTDEDYGDVYLGGSIDRIAIDLINAWILYFDDWKTDRKPPSYENLNRWIQGFWYASLLRANADSFMADDLVGQVGIKGRYEAVKWYGLERVFTNDDLDYFEAWAESLARTILRDKTAEPIINPGCGWCPIRMDCPAWVGLPADGATLLERMTDTKLEFLAPRLKEMTDVRLQLEKLEKDVKGMISGRVLAPDSGDEFKAGGTRWFLNPAEKRVADVKAVAKIMGDDFWFLASVTLGAIDNWVEDHPEERAEMEKAVGKVRAKPRLKSEPVSGE